MKVQEELHNAKFEIDQMKTSLRAATYRAKTMEDKMKSLQRRADGSARPRPRQAPRAHPPVVCNVTAPDAARTRSTRHAGSHTPGGGSAADGSAAGGSAAGGSAAGGSAAGAAQELAAGQAERLPRCQLGGLIRVTSSDRPSPDGALARPAAAHLTQGPLERSPEPSEEARASVRAQAVAQAVSANSAMWEAEEQEAERDVQRTLDGILAPLSRPRRRGWRRRWRRRSGRAAGGERGGLCQGCGVCRDRARTRGDVRAATCRPRGGGGGEPSRRLGGYG